MPYSLLIRLPDSNERDAYELLDSLTEVIPDNAETAVLPEGEVAVLRNHYATLNAELDKAYDTITPTTMRRTILIDPAARTITPAEYDGTLEGIYGLVKCDGITGAGLDPDGKETIYVDENGLFSGQPFFYHADHPQPLAGRGIIVGVDDEGADTPPFRSLIEHAARITFGNVHDLMRKCEADHPGLSL